MKGGNIYILLLLVSQVIWAQDVDFKATVSKSKLGINERLRLTFSVNKQGVDDFKPPVFKDFKIVGGP